MKSRATVNLYGAMTAGLAGLAAGALVGGVGGRLAMRAVAIIGGLDTGFSIEGSVAIMLIGAILGLIGGLIYGVIRPFIPLRGLWKGLAYGIFLAALISIPFFQAPEGELSLASPAVGAGLFGAIGLFYGLALEAGLLWLDDRSVVQRQRSVALVWLVPFALFLTLAFAGMLSLAEEFVRFPPAGSRGYLALGMDFQSAHELHAVVMMAFAAIYCSLATVVFWQSAGNRAGNVAALALVVLAAGWFRSSPITSGAMTGLAGVALLPALVKASGLALIVLTLFIWPDGRLQPGWTKAAFALCCLWLAAWLATPLRTALPEIGPLVITAGFYVSALAALVQRSRSARIQRRQIAPLLIGFGLAGALILALWTAALFQPALQVGDVALPETLFVFGPYLLPWMLLPTALLFDLRASSRVGVGVPASANMAQPAEALG